VNVSGVNVSGVNVSGVNVRAVGAPIVAVVLVVAVVDVEDEVVVAGVVVVVVVLVVVGVGWMTVMVWLSVAPGVNDREIARPRGACLTPGVKTIGPIDELRGLVRPGGSVPVPSRLALPAADAEPDELPLIVVV
jgi:hypothetical protein